MKLRSTAIGLSLATTLLFCLIAEASLRWAGYDGDHERSRLNFESIYGDVPQDSWVFRLPKERGGPFYINGERVEIEKPKEKTRVLILGDSGTFGSGVGYSKSYPLQLREILEQNYRESSVQVINAGVIGMTTVNELQLFESQLYQLKPDIVIVGLFMANDINFNLQHETLQNATPTRVRSVLGYFRQHSALVHFLVLKLKALNQRYHWIVASHENEGSLGASLSRIDTDGFELLNYLTGELALYEKKPTPLVSHAFELLESVFARFKELSRLRQFRFTVVLIPTASSLERRLQMNTFPQAEEELGRLHYKDSDLDFDQPHRRVLEVCQRQKIVCVDPTDAFRAAGTKKVILPGDDHPSVEGHQILAQKIFKKIFE